RHLLEFAAEAERDLIIPIVYWRAGICTDVQRLVPLQSDGNCPVHRLGSDDLAIDLEHAGAATADTAHVVEGQRGEAKPVVFEVNLEGVLARRQRLLTLPAHALQVEQVPDEDGLTLEDVKAPASEATALRGDHAVARLRRAEPQTRLRDLYFSRDRIGRVEELLPVAQRDTGQLAGVGEDVSTGRYAWPGRHHACGERVV